MTTTAAIFINDGTLGFAELLVFWLYLLLSFFAIINAVFKARRRRKEGIEAYRKVYEDQAKMPDTLYVGHYADEDETNERADKQYTQDNGAYHGPLLWLHIALPAIIGTFLGFILMMLSTFARWVDGKANGWPDSFSDGLPSVILMVIVALGVLLAMLLPFELASKTKNNYFDYLLAIWAAFSVAFAATMLGF
jgi:hypothetical protein